MTAAPAVPRPRRRHSLLTRLLLAALVIVLLAVAATAWLTARTATNAIETEQGQSLAQVKALYDRLLGYGATHRDWTGAGTIVRSEARRLGKRVTLTTTDRQLLADSAPRDRLGAASPFAAIDPLRPDPVLGGSGAVDPRVVGPYRLSARERRSADGAMTDVVRCLAKMGVTARPVVSPSGRPRIPSSVDDPYGCAGDYNRTSFPTERRALRSLVAPTLACAGRTSAKVEVRANWATVPPRLLAVDRNTGIVAPGSRIQSCLQDARRAQLRPYSAPAALLFVSNVDAGRAHVTFPLTRDTVERIVLVAAGVLLVAIAITVLLARRLTRPLRLLADSAARQQPAEITTRDEIGELAGALNEAMRRRDAAERQRQALVGDVAHELRNPLTNVRSWLEAAQDGLTSTDAALVAMLHDETVVLQRILDDLADLAAADSGTLRVHPEPIDLGECLTQAVEIAGTAAETAGVAIAVRTPQSITVTADPIRLRQLFGNLIANALRYTPREGTVAVTATLDGSIAVVDVTDTGTGIAPEHLPQVFERFWRADDSRTRATGGSGLGLAIVRQLVHAHGGTVTAESTVGVGSRFRVRLSQAEAGPAG